MKESFKKLSFLLILIIVVIIIGRFNNSINGKQGGVLKGVSHNDGGIKGIIVKNKEQIEMEGNEDILTKGVNNISDKYICQGTPKAIASELNYIGGGIRFSNEYVICNKI